MAENDGSSNTAIVAIVVIVLIALALLYFYGGEWFGSRDGRNSTVIENPNIEINPTNNRPSNR